MADSRAAATASCLIVSHVSVRPMSRNSGTGDLKYACENGQSARRPMGGWVSTFR
jgi:hypothetical protein